MKEKLKKLLMQVDKELIIDNLLNFDFFNEIKSDEDIPDNYFIYSLLMCDAQKKTKKKTICFKRNGIKLLRKNQMLLKTF